MTQWIWTLGIGSAVGLAGASVALIWLNRSAQLGGTLLSVFLGGAVTLFIAVLSQLKESSIERSFEVWVPIDTRTGLPHVPPPPDLMAEADMRSYFRRQRFLNIAMNPQFPKFEAGQQSATIIPKPMAPIQDDHRAISDACRQLVEYALLEDMRDSQTSSRVKAAQLDGQAIPSRQGPRPAVELSDFPTPRMRELLESHPFHLQERFDHAWNTRPLRLPPHATIRRRHVAESGIAISKDLILIERPEYFFGVITLESWGSERLSDELMRYRIAVSMKATFRKLTAGSPATGNAKAWFDWMFRTLAEMNGDA